MTTKTLLLALTAMTALPMSASPDSTTTQGWKKYLPTLHGTFRGRFEYDTDNGAGRFGVRNSRLSLKGSVIPSLGYFAQVDLSQNGKIVLLDTWADYSPAPGLKLYLGQMRVPFSVDASRLPHLYYFSNRSALARYLGNMRSVGFKGGYHVPHTGLYAEAGVFNSTSMTDHSVWQKGMVYSAKANYTIHMDAVTLLPEFGAQSIRPSGHRMGQIDASMSIAWNRLFVEGEYIRRHYNLADLRDTDAYNVFASYSIPLSRRGYSISVQARWDRMTAFSDGSTDQAGALIYTRLPSERLTGGVTYSHRIGPVHADLRLDYEHYIQRADEPSRAVAEVVIYF